MPRKPPVRDAVAQFRDDNLKLVTAPQAYVLLAEKGREAELDARIAILLTLVFAAMMATAVIAHPWAWLGWPDWSRVAIFVLGLIGLPAAVGTWRDTRTDRLEIEAETVALDRFLVSYDRDPALARAEGLTRDRV